MKKSEVTSNSNSSISSNGVKSTPTTTTGTTSLRNSNGGLSSSASSSVVKKTTPPTTTPSTTTTTTIPKTSTTSLSNSGGSIKTSTNTTKTTTTSTATGSSKSSDSLSASTPVSSTLVTKRPMSSSSSPPSTTRISTTTKPKTTTTTSSSSTLSKPSTTTTTSAVKKPTTTTTSKPSITTNTYTRPVTRSSSGITSSSTTPTTTTTSSRVRPTTTSCRTPSLSKTNTTSTRPKTATTTTSKTVNKQSSTTTIKNEEDPTSSPEFERVVSDFILLKDDSNNQNSNLLNSGGENVSNPIVIDADEDEDNSDSLDGIVGEDEEEQQEEDIVEEDEVEVENLDEEEEEEEIIEENNLILKDTVTSFTLSPTLNSSQEIYPPIPSLEDNNNDKDRVEESNTVEEEEQIETIQRNTATKSTSWMSSLFKSLMPGSTNTNNNKQNETTKSTFTTTTTRNEEEGSSTTTTTSATITTSFSTQPQPPQPPQISQPQPLETSSSSSSSSFLNKVLTARTNQNNNNFEKQKLNTLPPPQLYHQQSQQFLYGKPHHPQGSYYQNQMLSQSSPNLTSHFPNNHPANSNRYSQQITQQQFNGINNNYLMWPHNQPGGQALLPFQISPTRAHQIFQEWYKSLWFAPTDFREKLEQTFQLHQFFIPYYAFTTVVHSVHSGRVGFIKNDQSVLEDVVIANSNGSKNPQQDEVEWANGSTHPYTQTHSDVLIYAPGSFETQPQQQQQDIHMLAPSYLDIKEIATWRLEIAEPYHSEHPQLLCPVVDVQQHQHQRLLQQTQHHPQTHQPSTSKILVSTTTTTTTTEFSNKLPTVLDRLDWEEAWKYAEAKIKKNESYGNDSKLKKDYQAHTVADVETDTKFVNGQNGNRYGVRPYGAGSIKNTAIKFLTAGFSSEKTASLKVDHKITTNGMVSGKDLNEIDVHYNDEDELTPLYSNDFNYLLLPSSDQFLLLKMVGYFILKNNGTEELELESQKRMSDEIGGTCILKPGEVQTFSYKGSWCIAVKKGDYNNLELVRVETNSGGDKPAGDLLMN
eukprot:gene4712-5886_t